VARGRVDATHGADHLAGEQDVLDGDHLGQQIDAGLVVDAGVEEDAYLLPVRVTCSMRR
jgi:hypothetical protein